MEMPTASRVALIRRLSSIVGSDRQIPTSWEGFSLTERLLIEDRDPEAASILKNQMSADVELAVLSGKLSETAPKFVSEAEQRQAAVDAWVAANPLPDPEELERQRRESLMAGEAARQESAMIAAAALAAQGRSQRGW
jgi:hypothetical protein